MTVLTAPPIVDDATRRQFLALLGAAGLLTGCAGPSAPATAVPGYPRTVTHTDGTTTLPAPPRRIACLSPLWDLEALLSLGVAPVLVGVRPFVEEFLGSPTALWPWAEDALTRLGAAPERINAEAQPNVESIAAARPDLIIAPASFIGEARARLESLAPTIVLGFDWRANLPIVGEALDRAADAERLIDEADARIATTLDGIDIGGARIAFAYPIPDVVQSAAHPSSSLVDIFQRAGFALVDELADAATEQQALVQLSYEEIGRLAPADLIVITAYSPDDAAALQTNPLFRNLPAVRDGRVHVIEQGPVAQALASFSPLNAEVCLAEVRTAATLLTR